jgi:uncharacterized protein DUF4388
LNEDVQSALVEFQRYLLDQIPPLTVSDSVETLMAQPPQLMMKQIHSWAVEQSRFQQAAMSDFLFHALKKIYLFASLKLVDRAAVEGYLNHVIPLAMQVCPADEREVLRTNLMALRDSADLLASASGAVVDVSRTPKKTEPQRGPLTDVIAKSARRLGLVIDRLAKYVKSPAPVASPTGTPAPFRAQPAAELLTMAAASSTSDKELREYIENLKPYTGDNDPANLLHVLGRSVPSWDIVVPSDAQVKSPAPIEAMHKIISLTNDATEMTKRFRELMMTAVEQFNDGSLSAAISMLELAKSVAVEKKIDGSTVDRMTGEAAETLSSEQIKKYSESKSKRALLPKAFSFFPTLTKERLFEELRGEQRPERRRALLALLEAHGADARALALDELEKELNRPAAEADTYYLRNVIYLLHRIARDPEAPVDRELGLLTRSSERGQSIYVIKEAVTPLGQIKTGDSVKLLVIRLAEFEAILLRKDTSMYPIDEMHKVLDRIIGALGRIATPAALLTIARHGMKPNPALGDTRGRLATLSQHDLSFDEQTVNIIIKAIRDDLPKKILGKVLPKLTQPPPIRLIEALSSTRSELVESLFAEIAEKYPEEDVGRVAAATLENRANAAKQGSSAPDGSTASLTGDLQFFGLPAVLQSLADNQSTGIVTLSSKHAGHTNGKILFMEGKFADAQAGPLRGPDALYQLLERPIVGTFAFVPQPPFSVKTKTEPQAVMSLLLEGMRRHDELKQTSVVVPDDLALKPTSVKPSPDPEETDPAVIREVWMKASTGGRVAEWEAQVSADAYRVRRLIARWLEEGALQPV